MWKWTSEMRRVTIYIKALHFAFMYRDASHLWRSFSHIRTKINIQFLNKAPGNLACNKALGNFPCNKAPRKCHAIRRREICHAIRRQGISDAIRRREISRRLILPCNKLVQQGAGKSLMVASTQMFSFFKALWWPGFFCKFLASQTYDFNQTFSVGRENVLLEAHITS